MLSSERGFTLVEMLVGASLLSVLLVAMIALMTRTHRDMGKLQSRFDAHQQFDQLLRTVGMEFSRRYIPYAGESPALDQYSAQSCGNLLIRQRVPRAGSPKNIRLVVFNTRCAPGPKIRMPANFMSAYLGPCNNEQRLQVEEAVWETDPGTPSPPFSSADRVTTMPGPTDSMNMFALCFRQLGTEISVEGGAVVRTTGQEPMSFQKHVSLLTNDHNPLVELIR